MIIFIDYLFRKMNSIDGFMKKILLAVWLFGGVGANVAFANVEQYVAAVDQISGQYRQDVRKFFSSLNAQQTGFTPQQQAQYCGMLGNYIDRLYQAADQNREALDGQFKQLDKQDVIDQVMSSKEMLMLQKYNIQCDLK